jgi:hypothetical protein
MPATPLAVDSIATRLRIKKKPQKVLTIAMVPPPITLMPSKHTTRLKGGKKSCRKLLAWRNFIVGD